MEKVLVDKDIISSLKAFYFGVYTNPVQGASNRAYTDMNRTIRFNGIDNDIRASLRERTTYLLKDEIEILQIKEITNQMDFDLWHHNLCEKIKKLYWEDGINLTIGQTQKWVNMTIKYLYILEEFDFAHIFRFLHVPLDNYIFDIAEENLGITRPTIAWSKWDDYDGKYLDYQKQIRNKMTCYEPLRWEFKYWLKSARQIEV